MATSDEATASADQHAEPSQAAPALTPFAAALMGPISRLVVGPRRSTIHVHKELACRVPFLRAALEGEFAEDDSGVKELPEEETEAVAPIIEFLYKERLKVPEKPWMERKLAVGKIYMLADKWSFDKLADVALAFVREDRDGGSNADNYDLAWLRYWRQIYSITAPGSKLRIPAHPGLKASHMIRVLHGHEEYKAAVTELPDFALDLLYLAATESIKQDAK
ncbi:hypothetical protein DFJ74DRAFT_730093 [Hyaloraphidium curvatum]|nr:hypothetical protein DFJ74DRAFT_730093 [Hyaloraphidium curvatum]